jgi:hypothetical protein
VEESRSRRLPSPATVLALIAVVLSVGGVAYALQANSVKSKHIKNGQVKPPDLAKSSKAGWVFVNGAAGSTYNKSTGASAERLNDGVYFVRFPYSVRNRALVSGTSGDVGDSVRISRCGGASGDSSGCSPDENDNPKTVFVETFDSAGNDEDVDFWLAAIP